MDLESPAKPGDPKVRRGFPQGVGGLSPDVGDEGQKQLSQNSQALLPGSREGFWRSGQHLPPMVLLFSHSHSPTECRTPYSPLSDLEPTNVKKGFPVATSGKEPSLLMQDTWIRSLIWEDPICCGATELVGNNY